MNSIWRVENKWGAGPYIGKGNIYDALHQKEHYKKFHEDIEQRPGINFDPGLRCHFKISDLSGHQNTDGWLCGFRNLRQYGDWFPTSDIRDFLARTGFKLVRFEVSEDNIVHGSKQSVFLREFAKITAKRPCNDGGIAVTPPQEPRYKQQKWFNAIL